MQQSKKEDLRIIRTKKLLSSTLLNMLETQSIEDISIVDICQKSLIHRTTFYSHFKDKYDLFKYTFNVLKNEIIDINLLETKSYENLVKNTSECILNYIEKNHVKISNILKNNHAEKIIYIVEKDIEIGIKYLVKNYTNQTLENLETQSIISFLTGGITNLLYWWTQNIDYYSKEEMIRSLENLIFNNIKIKEDT
ncbi:MAG: TetR/AcrR family transcriptional regulator C-terminal domain-containing protein [Clostridia bacterium]|nr:TetR/AcrR family transcriptional regulator C-terminal domain-containing protein [Clostridia bacterium]